MHRNGYLGTSGKSFGDLATFLHYFLHLYAECLSIYRPRFPYKVQNFGDFEMFSLIFYHLKFRRISTSGLFYLLRQV